MHSVACIHIASFLFRFPFWKHLTQLVIDEFLLIINLRIIGLWDVFDLYFSVRNKLKTIILLASQGGSQLSWLDFLCRRPSSLNVKVLKLSSDFSNWNRAVIVCNICNFYKRKNYIRQGETTRHHAAVLNCISRILCVNAISSSAKAGEKYLSYIFLWEANDYNLMMALTPKIDEI